MTAARWPDGALLGLAASMRTFVPAGAMAVRGRLTGRARAAALIAAAGELAVDKAPFATPRTDLPAFGGRIASGALSGAAVAGPAGAVAGGASAAAGTLASYRARKLLCAATGLPDPAYAVVEDAAAMTLAAYATRPTAEPDAVVEPEPPLRAAARGLAAGLAGTVAMTVAQSAYYQLTGAEPSDAPLKVAEKVADVPRKHRTLVNTGMHVLYGTSWGVPFGVLESRIAGAQPEPAGVAFGLTVWAAGLAQLPALGLARPPWKQSPLALATDAGFHLVYGLGAAAALRALSPGS